MTNEKTQRKNRGKGKDIPVTGHGGPYGCERSRLPHYLDKRLTDSGKVVSPMRHKEKIERERKKRNLSTESITLVVVHHPLIVEKKTEPHAIRNKVVVMLTLLVVSIRDRHWKVKPKCNDMVLSMGHDYIYWNFWCQN
jgi:hypothetical protein